MALAVIIILHYSPQIFFEYFTDEWHGISFCAIIIDLRTTYYGKVRSRGRLISRDVGIKAFRSLILSRLYM